MILANDLIPRMIHYPTLDTHYQQQYTSPDSLYSRIHEQLPISTSIYSEYLVILKCTSSSYRSLVSYPMYSNTVAIVLDGHII